MDYSNYEPHIDFIYTTLLMVWGGSCIGIGLIAVPYIFGHMHSPKEASKLTTQIFRRQDMVIRIIAIGMLFLFYFKSRLAYSFQYIEWVSYVIVLHCFIIAKIVSKRLWKLRDKIDSFESPIGKDPERIKFHRWHVLIKILYLGQIVGVIALLYLHAFGL